MPELRTACSGLQFVLFTQIGQESTSPFQYSPPRIRLTPADREPVPALCQHGVTKTRFDTVANRRYPLPR